MKKRKLKKKIKKLKSDIKWLKGCQRNLALRENNNANKIKNLSDAYTNRFDKFNPNDIKTINNRIDGLCMDANYLRSSIERINGRCDILDRRTQTDYDKIIPKSEGENNGN